MTPRPVWNPDLPSPDDFPAQWEPVPDNVEFDNGFKAQWELFLTHVYRNVPLPYDLLDGARGGTAVPGSQLPVSRWSACAAPPSPR